MSHSIDTEVIRKGLAFLKGVQRDDGRFPIGFSWGPVLKENCQEDETVFATCLVAYSLSFVSHPEARALLDRAVGFLIQQREPQGLWRFWPVDRPRRIIDHRYAMPPDADDSASAAMVLRRAGIGTEGLAEVLLAHRTSSGIFHTWIIPRSLRTWWISFRYFPPREWLAGMLYRLLWIHTPAAPGDLDAAVNATILAWLGNGPHSPPVVAWLREALEHDRIATIEKWYDPLMDYYMMARALSEGAACLRPLAPLLSERTAALLAQAAHRDTALSRAAAACIWLNLEIPDDAHRWRESLEILRSLQASDGSWAGHATFYGGPKKPCCWGGKEITTAFALEALAKAAERSS